MNKHFICKFLFSSFVDIRYLASNASYTGNVNLAAIFDKVNMDTRVHKEIKRDKAKKEVYTYYFIQIN